MDTNKIINFIKIYKLEILLITLCIIYYYYKKKEYFTDTINSNR